MSHPQNIFISYAHDDGEIYRKELIKNLDEAGFKNIFYDKQNIEWGEEWRKEIDIALEESFIMIVVLTPKACESHFITYEWSYAIAAGIKVIPIVFEKLPEGLIHPLVDRKQYAKWEGNSTAKELVDIVREYSNIQPDILYLNRTIINYLNPFRILCLVIVWAYEYVKFGTIKYEMLIPLIVTARNEAHNVYYNKLPEFMRDSRPSFTSRQLKLCRILTTQIAILSNALNNLDIDLETWGGHVDYSNLLHSVSTKLATIDESIASLGTEHQWVSELKSLLKVLNDKTFSDENFRHVSGTVWAMYGVQQSLSEEDYNLVKNLIDLIKNSN